MCFPSKRLSAVQVLQQCLERQATLVVLDNVSADTAAAAVPLQGRRHADSLVLATAWGSPAVQKLAKVAIDTHGQLRPPHFQILEMASSMVLTEAEACELILRRMTASMQTALQQTAEMTQAELAIAAGDAAAALRFSQAPHYVPKVLSVCACTLGLVGPTPDRLRRLLQQLHAAVQPAVHAELGTQAAEDAIFGQLAACLEQIAPLALQLWLAIVQAASLELFFSDKPALLLWLHCHAELGTSLEEIQLEEIQQQVGL